MVIKEEEVLQLLTEISELNNVMVTIEESRKGGWIAFGTTVVGGLVLGPPGLAVGGIIGGIIAAWHSKGKFKCIIEAIRDDFTEAEKRELIHRIAVVICDLKCEDISEVLRILWSNPDVKQMIIDEVFFYFEKNSYELCK